MADNFTGHISGTPVDLRVVEFFKSSPSAPLRDHLLPDDANDYICLGHFDLIHVREVPQKGDSLRSIEADHQSQHIQNSNYTSPLYLLHYPDASANLKKFWDVPLCCMAVSRIHFSPFNSQGLSLENENGMEPYIQVLKDAVMNLANQSQDPSLGDISVLIEGEWVHCVFYHTLELGDIAAVLKSNSMASCLHVLRRLLETAPVGDVYSYCGVHTALLGENTSVHAAAEIWDATGKAAEPYSCHGASDAIRQTLPNASIRFSVHSSRCAELFWEDLSTIPGIPKSRSFVIGTADAILDMSGCTLETYLEYTRGLLWKTYALPKSGSQGVIQVDMHDAFDDVISRIGIPYGAIFESARLPEKNIPPDCLLAIQNNLRQKLAKVTKTFGQEPWAAALSAQTNTLITMMENCVMDDLSILIWPSVSALMERLNSVSTITLDQASDIRSFLDKWDILKSDITRLEGQLVQSPELYASRYYTPATLMVFYMALLNAYNELLLSVNQDKHRQDFIPLITYDVEPRANTLCILDSACGSGGSPAEIEYEGRTPLLVSLPVSLMFRPFDVSNILCHEMSHYTGDSTRLREKRFHSILHACAAMIAKAWCLDGQIKYRLRGNSSEDILEKIIIKLKDCYHEICKENHFYLNQAKIFLPQALSQVFLDQNFQSTLVAKYLSTEVLRKSFIEYTQKFSPYMRYEILKDLKADLETLLLLYQECYADLAAILCLGLTEQEYFLSMFYWEWKYIGARKQSNEHKLQLLSFQAALVLDVVSACKLVSKSSFNRAASQEMLEAFQQWREQVRYYQDEMAKKGDVQFLNSDNKLIAIQGEYLSLKSYLTQCAQKLTEGLKNQDTAKKQAEIRKMLSAVAAGPDFKEVHKIIADYRSSLFYSRAMP
ncbi:hypothetical protein JQM68_12165 [Oscillibacter valericigenes]|uniref:hypothetical protein n=1 Tax=Oscillibacter valericigenes TaxID=351091 RepID=UPI001F430816|nr:hypothetical protein [Oscillibacter valericigenes]MCF2617940.1 hypothetical protein [Oscillibacter valericigenes]